MELLKSRSHTFCKNTRMNVITFLVQPNPSSNYLEIAFKTLPQLIGVISVILSYITVITGLH